MPAWDFGSRFTEAAAAFKWSLAGFQQEQLGRRKTFHMEGVLAFESCAGRKTTGGRAE